MVSYATWMNDVIRMMTFRGEGAKLSDRVAEELGQRILQGTLAPGTKLPSEAELGVQLGVSRTVVRDAIRTLSTRGLVAVRHGHGMVVALPSDAVFSDALVVLVLRSELTVGDVLEARAVIEAGVCPVAASRASADDRSQMAAEMEAFTRSVEESRWPDALAAHLDFHLGLLRATQLPAAEIMLRPMQHMALLSSFPPIAEDPQLWEVPAHRRILDAVLAGDEQATRVALQEHYTIMESETYAELRASRFRDSQTLSRVLDWSARNRSSSLPATAASIG